MGWWGEGRLWSTLSRGGERGERWRAIRASLEGALALAPLLFPLCNAGGCPSLNYYFVGPGNQPRPRYYVSVQLDSSWKLSICEWVSG